MHVMKKVTHVIKSLFLSKRQVHYLLKKLKFGLLLLHLAAAWLCIQHSWSIYEH